MIAAMQDAAAGRREPVERVDRRFGRRLRNDRRHAHDQVVQPSIGNLGDETVVEDVLDLRQTPQEHEHAQDHPRRPGLDDLRAREAVPDGRSLGLGVRHRRPFARRARPDLFRMPDLEEQRERAHRADRCDDVDEPRPVDIRTRNCGTANATRPHQDRRPDLDHPAEADERPDQPERHQHREERELPADHCGERLQVDAGDRGEHDDRRAQRAVRDGAVLAISESRRPRAA
jgi:hypothetical protein